MDQETEIIIEPNGEFVSPDTFQGGDGIDHDHKDEIMDTSVSPQRRMDRNPKNIARRNLFDEIKVELRKAAPWVALGLLISAILSIIPLKYDMLRYHLSNGGRKTSLGILLSIIKASIIGLLTPLCSCGALPIAASFVANGVPLSSAVSFLTASQSAGIDSAIITWGLLGPLATCSRLLGSLVLAVSVGVAVASKEELKKVTEIEQKKKVTNSSGFVKKFVKALIKTTFEIFPMVFLGLVLSTTFAHYFPFLKTSYKELQKFSSIGPFLLRLGVLVLALPLQLCEHSSVAFAAGIQKAGGSPGLAFAFLLSAPATNLPSLLLLMKSDKNNVSYGCSVTLRLAVALVFSALILSYVVDALGIDMRV